MSSFNPDAARDAMSVPRSSNRDEVLQEAAAAICQHCREGVELTYRTADEHGLNEGWHHRWHLTEHEHPSAHAGWWNERCEADQIHRLKHIWLIELQTS